MTVLEWTADLTIGLDFMDEDHEAFVALINQFAETAESDLPALYGELLHHSEEHFAREEDLMRRVGFFAYDCHKGEHTRVLAEMRQVQTQLEAGDLASVRTYVTSHVPQWFIHHRNTMDAATAAFAAQHAA